MSIKEVDQDKKQYLDLLLLADEQENMVDRYLERGTLFVLFESGNPVAVAVVTDEGDGVCELQNLAVVPDRQRQGIGRRMVEDMARRYGASHHTMLVGTGDSPRTLPFYFCSGFSESHRIKNYFTDYYDHPIVEAGVQIVDRVVLKRPLWVLETPRLGFRRLSHADHDTLRPILGDPETMYAWEYGFNDAQITQWIDRCQMRYAHDGYAYYAAIDKQSGALVGLMGLLNEDIDGDIQLGVGYILARNYWGKGYANEGVRSWLDYAFAALGATRVVAVIRPENTASRRVAKRLGMRVVGQYVKNVNGKEMLHLVYAIDYNKE
ncbi:GNAT family N-acetyltransferase [Oscillospiraceae bacterium LTW-04]|nr:GNAT family N-acetyltransferase [Oscillospiraceae bacterium MB24-C1]